MRWFASRPSGLPFPDRAEAGRRLAEHIGSPAWFESESPEADRGAVAVPARRAIVLAIPRGGVPVGAALARTLGLPLDVIVAHKLGAPGEPELAVGAVAADGTILVEPWATDIVGSDLSYVERAAEDEIARARSREAALRAGRPAPVLTGRTAIIVDDGIATGATMHVAVLAARAAGAARIVVASPVGAAESIAKLREVADEVSVLATPEPFYAVGEFYVRFDQVSDEEVAALLAEGVAGGDGEGTGGGGAS